MENLKDFLTPTTYSFHGYIVAICCVLGGTIFSTRIGILRDGERRNFQCNVESKSHFDKNFLRASCFDQYDQQYNLPLPLYGFVVLSFFILTLISIVYSSCCVKSRVEEVLEQECKSDVENPRPRPTITTRRVFNCYLAQLLGRLILGIVFTVLQNFVLYPSGFPTSFVCEMKLEKSKVPVTNSSFIDCRNSIGSDKDVWAMLVWIVNVILACLVAGEIIYVMKRACENKTFMNDSEFCQRHLFNRRNTLRRVTQYRVTQYRMNQQTRIIEDTQVLEPLIPGENEGYKNLDDVYVNLIIRTGRSRPDLNMERMDKLRILEEYVKCPEDSRIIKPEELLQPNKDSSDPHKILILGCPGIGKTLLCKKLLRELNNGELLREEHRNCLHLFLCHFRNYNSEEMKNKFLYLFLFHFRNFNSEEMKSMSLQTLLNCGKHSEEKLNKELFQSVLEHPDKILLVFDGLDEFKDHGECMEEELFQSVLEHPDKILLVFDGLDEFKDHKKCMEEEEKHKEKGVADVMPFGALYVKLVKGKILKGATVLTTTRPYAIDSVGGLPFDRTVEILGFSTEKVKDYCTKFFHDDRNAMERIWQHVQSNLNLLYLCYIPVNCFIVCSFLEKIIKLANLNSLQGVALPTTLTEIYQGALRLFIFKHHPEYQTKTLKKTDLTSDGTFSNSVEETLSKLEALAMKGIDERRLVFELEEVKGMENCGLLNRMQDVQTAPFTYKLQYCFIHLTMQEFVAARGIAKMDPQYLKEFISSKAQDNKWHLVIQFAAGLLRGKEAVINDIFVENLIDNLLVNSYNYSKSIALLMMKCLHEVNDISSVKRAAAELNSNSEFTNHIDLSGHSLTPVDCTAIVYFLKHIDNLEYLNVSSNPLGDGGCSELSKLMKAGGPQKLNLCACDISDQGLITILEAMKTAETCNLSQLFLYGNRKITDKGYSYLGDALMDEKCKLTELVIDNVYIDKHNSLKFSNALKHENCKLTKLQLVGYGTFLENERVYLNICSALVDKNCKLRDLMLPVQSGLSHIYEVLKNENCRLNKLTLLLKDIDEVILCVCKALKHVNCKFTELHVIPCYVSDSFRLSDAPQNTNAIFIHHLSLDKYSFTDLCISYLCDALKHEDCKLTRLSLVAIGKPPETLTKKGIEALQNAITHDNCKLEELTLDFNHFLHTDKEFRKLECTCILNGNGHKVLATKDESGQYEEISLSIMAFDRFHYTIKIKR